MKRGSHRRQSALHAAPIALALLLLAEPAHAYVDPGTGSYLVQVLLALFFGVAFTLRRAWRGVIRAFLKRPEPKDSAADAPVESR